MRATIRKIGNSQGVILPKPVLAQVGLTGSEVEMTVERDSIVLRKPKKQVRAGWAEASKALADAGDDKLTGPEFPNDDDAKLKW
jgi:antitoxin MazE